MHPKIRGRNTGASVRTAVVLNQNVAEKLGGIKIVWRKIFPEKFATPNDVTFTHGEELQRQPLAFAIVSKDVDVAFAGRRHLLLLGKFDYSLAQIAIFSREFVAHLFGRVQHSRFKFVGQFRVATLQQHAHVAHGLLIFFRRAQTLNARPETAFDVVFQTRTRRFAIDLNVAGTQLKGAIDQIDRATRHRGRQKRTKIKRAVVLDPASDHAFWKRFVD